MKNVVRNAVLILLVIAALAVVATACGNRQVMDTNYTFDRAIIRLPNGEIVEGEVQSWRDYDACDQVQVKINNKVYFCHHSNVVLIDD